MSLASGACCAKAGAAVIDKASAQPGPATRIKAFLPPRTAAAPRPPNYRGGRYGNERELALAARGFAQRGKVSAHACGIDAEVAPPLPRRRAHVDAAARAQPGNTNDNVVGEAVPAAPRACLDPACRLVSGYDRPAHLLRGGERAGKRGRGRQFEDHG